MSKDDTVDMIRDINRRMERIRKECLEPSIVYEMTYDFQRKELMPLTNISETFDELIVKFDLPCVKRENIELKCTDEILSIKARMSQSCRLTPLGSNKEFDFEGFRKSIRLPVSVDVNNSNATFKNGVLEIRFAKIS